MYKCMKPLYLELSAAPAASPMRCLTAWFKMLLGLGGTRVAGGGKGGACFISFLRKTQKCIFSYRYVLFDTFLFLKKKKTPEAAPEG